MSVVLYGIKSCDTCRKARRWLGTHGIDYRDHDLREDGIDAALLAEWCRRLDWAELLNRRSTTWRSLDESRRAVNDAEGTRALLLAHPTLIKRPVLDTGDRLLVGFSESAFSETFGR